MSLKRCNSISTVFTLPMHAVSTPQRVNITNNSTFLTADSLFNFQGFYISAKICFHIIRRLLNQNESCMLCRLVNKGTQWKPLKENNRSTEKNKPHPICMDSNIKYEVTSPNQLNIYQLKPYCV